MSKAKELGEARVALTLSSETLDVDKVTSLLKLEPTRVIHKGDIVGRIPAPLVAGETQWICAHELSAAYGTDSVLNELLVHLVGVKDVLMQLTKEATVTLQLYVKSDYAHMSYQLSPETMQHLVAVGIPLEISSFSWGGL